MDKYTANSLIANSGIQFKITKMKVNPEEPVVLPTGRTLKYTFLETIDFLNDCKVRFDVCASKDGLYVPVDNAKNNGLIEETPSGALVIDDIGVPKLRKDSVMAVVENYDSDSSEVYSINSLNSYRIKKNGSMKTAFELLLNKWLPVPMYEEEMSGESTGYPDGWCRLKIMPIGEREKNGVQEYRLVWAFDTRLASDIVEGMIRPAFLDDSVDEKTFSMCNRVDVLFASFLNLPDGVNDAPVGDYIASILGVDLSADVQFKYKFIGYYVYLINYLRITGVSPAVTLFNKDDGGVPVDMSVDIGNSRTCSVLFENGDFTKARMLRLRDLTEPWRKYEKAFDMRVVFRKADFGGDLTLDKTLFQWPSIVRIGEEAKHLVYRAQENKNGSENATNCSSPKRYLWDDKPYSKRWDMMVVEDDPTNVKVNPHIFVENFTDHFDDDGTYLETKKEFDLFSMGMGENKCHYSRQSLMTFVMIEMMQQALCYVNSSTFRFMHGQIGSKRYLRNIIVTCPTAMPIKEQRALRLAAQNASKLLRELNPSLPEMTITPDPTILHATDDVEDLQKRGWIYDEAFASQLVYLYAELVHRYGGRTDQFFKMKGHWRKNMEDRGQDGSSVTIGTIDIGAGTTDVMITAYGQKGGETITPVPLYYDSFYTAGDDIIHNIIRDVILEGKFNESATLGSINSALSYRVQHMSPNDLLQIPRVADTKMYSDRIESIRKALSEEEVRAHKYHLTQELMHHFFADNSANQSEQDRQRRSDFCTQVSLPMAQYFLELVKQGTPTKLCTFEDFFPIEKPAPYLLEHFRNHFGFGLEDLSWRFDPQVIDNIIRDTMEPLIKALSVVMYAYHCDILVLSGRPTNLEALNELFLKYIPISPSRLVCLNQYRVGRWYPLATEQGYFQESQKAIVAVGAEVGYLASTNGFNGLVLDFSSLAKNMKSTARYIGLYDADLQEVKNPFMTPNVNTVTLKGVSVFPYCIGCKQFDASKYQARPLYSIYNKSAKPQLNIVLQRNYHEDRENIVIDDVTDMDGEEIPKDQVELRMQTIARDGQFWMDKGSFILKIQEN